MEVYQVTTVWTILVNISFMLATLWLLDKGTASLKAKMVFLVISSTAISMIHFVLSKELIFPKNIGGGWFFLITIMAACLLLILFYMSPLRAIFGNITQDEIQLVQGLRVFVAAGFFMEGVLQVIPSWFSIMDGFMHATSAFLALIAAHSYVKQTSNRRIWLWLANIVGVLDIITIVTTINFVVWQDLGPFHNMHYVVFYTGVLLLWFHLVSTQKLIQHKD